MKRKIFLFLLLLSGVGVKAQFYNEWIDPSRTYYKFKVAANGIYRITRSTLDGAGLGSTPAEHFQLFRNGQEVPLFTSQPSGPLPAGGYIEFYGEMNDGKPDTKLYSSSSIQPDDKWSLETDTATYFLSVNNKSANSRYTAQANNVAGNTLSPETYFFYTHKRSFKTFINPGFAADLRTAYVYSSSYDPGEGWSSREINPISPLSDSADLAVFTGGPPSVLSVTASGNTYTNRNLSVSINGTQVLNEPLNLFSAANYTANIATGLIGRSGGDRVTISNISTVSTDRMVVARYSITYPRKFDFGGNKQFEFQLNPNPAGTYIEVSNFNGGASPVLFDITNRQRYVGNLSGGLVRFALSPSLMPRRLVLLNADASELKNVAGLTPRSFINFADAANQADYIMISHRALNTSSNGNPVEAYRAYRASAEGGSFNAKVFDIEQLTDQFAYGIKGHPLAVKNFISYSLNSFRLKPKYVILLGRGTVYSDIAMRDSFPASHAINLVPTFGNPGSDNLLASLNYTAVPEIPIGRIAAVNGDELDIFLQKVKEHEMVRRTAKQTSTDKAWMKNVVHAIGGSDPFLQWIIFNYMSNNKNIIKDTLYGSEVFTFSKNTSLSVEQLTSDELQRLFEEGLGMLTYFGHSSQNTLEFNIDDPNKYNNKGKYPLFVINGCNSGNMYTYDTLRRFGQGLSLSEKYMLTRDRGSIGFLASSHFGIVNYLNLYTSSLYNSISSLEYANTLGEMQKRALKVLLDNVAPGDFYGRMHAEQVNLHGDPAVRMHVFPQPDYLIEEPMVRISPVPVSVAESTFDLNIRWMNIGKAVNDSFRIRITRQLPTGTTLTIFDSKVKATLFKDSMLLKVPINPITDKGENSITVTLDADGRISEASETNNSVTQKFLVIEDELRPAAPFNYAIVNKQPLTFYASTANPFAPPRSYIIEVDTTELFNSSFKKTQTLTSPGGLLEFTVPGLTLQDSMVYYWRTAQVPSGTDPYKWNSSSFVFLPNSTPGYNQSHFFQMRKNDFVKLGFGPDRSLQFAPRKRVLSVKTGLFPTFVNDKLQTSLDDDFIVTYGCKYGSLQFSVYDNLSMAPWSNTIQPGGLGRFGSWPPCVHNENAFEFPYTDPTNRKRAIDFLESLPPGTTISMTNLGANFINSFINSWMADTATLGSGKSLYHTLKRLGFSEIDKYTQNLPFIFITRIGDIRFPTYQSMGSASNEYLQTLLTVDAVEVSGTIESPWFGPASKWNRFSWRGVDLNPFSDRVSMEVYGRNYAGVETRLATVNSVNDTSLSFVDAKAYPFVKLKMLNSDPSRGTPHQLNYWRINADLPPEGAIAPNLYFKSKDSIDVGEPYQFEVAFKNISQSRFDSVAVQLNVTDASNVSRNLSIPRLKPLASGDTLVLKYTLDSRKYVGRNTLFLNFNPNYDQPEQYLFNNFLFRSFKVQGDEYDPTLDVTFDGLRILNRDIVSSRPHIQARLTDNNKFMLLDDTSMMRVKVRYPNDVIRQFRFDNDTLVFTPATAGAGKENSATIDFRPAFLEDGFYDLIVSGADKSGNNAGAIEYKVTFSIVNKPMISNLLNYPNPFTTSTAFVFTLTGSQVPQNLRIQILTITGKVVREITKEELGPIRIGRNITDYKWDGTDQYGQKLANGVYLYRVITNLNGKSLDKLELNGLNGEKYSDRSTDKYFQSGYGKMYLMR
jgi:hypothetical protein